MLVAVVVAEVVELQGAQAQVAQGAVAQEEAQPLVLLALLIQAAAVVAPELGLVVQAVLGLLFLKFQIHTQLISLPVLPALCRQLLQDLRFILLLQRRLLLKP